MKIFCMALTSECLVVAYTQRSLYQVLQKSLIFHYINLSNPFSAQEAKNYVVIDVPHRSDRIVSTTSGKTCIREGRSSRPMSPDELEDAVKSLSSYDWSSEPLDVDITNAIDKTALNESRVDFCQHRGLTDQPSDGAFLEAIGATKNGKLIKSGKKQRCIYSHAFCNTNKKFR